MINDILGIVDKFKQRPGAVWIVQEDDTTLACTYPHEQFYLNFTIKGAIKNPGCVKLASLAEDRYESYEKNGIDIKLYNGRISKWQSPWTEIFRYDDPLMPVEDLIVTEELLSMLETAPVYNDKAPVIADGLHISTSTAIVTNSITMVTREIEMKPSKAFTIPSHFFSFLTKHTPLTIGVYVHLEKRYVLIQGADWRLIYLAVDDYPEVDKVIPKKWDTQVYVMAIKDFIYNNLKNIDGEEYLCNMHFTPESDCLDIQLFSLNGDDKPIDFVAGKLSGVIKTPTTKTDCYLQLDLVHLEKLLRIHGDESIMRFTWGKSVLTPVSLVNPRGYELSLIMPMRAEKDLQWIDQ